jgi:hypothetical protein
MAMDFDFQNNQLFINATEIINANGPVVTPYGIITAANMQAALQEISDYLTAGGGAVEFTAAEKTKLSNIEELADVTDASNVEAAGAVMDSDFSEVGIMRRTGAGSYVILKDNLGASLAPTINDDASEGYSVFSIWVDTTANNAYICLDNTNSAAVWKSMTSGAGSGDLLAANNLSDLNSATISRQNLGVEIGVDVQPHSTILDNTTGVFTLADESKLDGIQANATTDQTPAQIKTAYESNPNTNVYTDVEQTKLGYLTATQAVDLDAVESRVEELQIDDIVEFDGITFSNILDSKHDSATTSTTNQIVMEAWPLITYGSVELYVQVYDTVTGHRHTSKILVTNDGANAHSVEYGVVFTDTNPLASFDVDVLSGNIRFLVTPASTNITEFKMSVTGLFT